MNHVKIVATIGPQTSSPKSIQALRDAGMDIARLNGSHADLNWHKEMIGVLRKVAPDVPVLLDIPGRKIRMGTVKHESTLSPGDQLVLTTEDGHDGPDKISVSYHNLHKELSSGDVILVDEGSLRLTVVDVDGRDVICRADSQGRVSSGKGIHVLDVALKTEFLSARDHQLISFACQAEVDFIGMSFVETAAQVEAVRSLLGKGGPGIVSKIESQGALKNVGEVAQASDALMIDRGDLSLGTSMESVALLQKQILVEARRSCCPVIVATEMLNSMIENSVPTKAELSDITNSVLDGAAALMLSGETAVGKFPVQSVELMRRVADAASENLRQSVALGGEQRGESVPQAIADAIALLCNRLEVTKIVAITISGYAARMIAAKMPGKPILAVSNDPIAARGFNLLHGTKGVYVDIPFSRTNLDHIPRCLEELWNKGELFADDLILVTAVSYPKSGNRMNLIETHKVSDLQDSLGWRDELREGG